jgi:hypothetical protein
MKKRDQGISSAWSFLLGVVLFTLVVPGVLLGPARSVRLIVSAVSGTLAQGGSQRPAAALSHELPVIELLPEGFLVRNGVRYPMEVERTAAGEEVIRSITAEDRPFEPYERILLAPPSTDILGGQLALWIAGRMGVPVPASELVYLIRDGSDAGIHEVFEFVDGSFEQYRNISDARVAVYAPASGTHEAWSEVANWQVRGKEDREATARLGTLIVALNDTTISNAERRRQLEILLDVDAFLRYLATMQMLRADGTEAQMALVDNPRIQRFYPVLTYAPLVPVITDEAAGPKDDPLARALLSVSDWRSERDRLVAQGLRELHVSGQFMQQLDAMAGQVAPSLATSSVAGRRPLFSMRDADLSAATLQWSADGLRSRVTSHWERLSTALAGGMAETNTTP